MSTQGTEKELGVSVTHWTNTPVLSSVQHMVATSQVPLKFGMGNGMEVKVIYYVQEEA